MAGASSPARAVLMSAGCRARACWLVACQAGGDQRVAEASARDRFDRHAGERRGLADALALLARRRDHPSDAEPRLDAIGHGAQFGVVRFDRERLAAGVAQQRDVLVGAAGVGHARDLRGRGAQRGGECVEVGGDVGDRDRPARAGRRAPSRRSPAACRGTCTASIRRARRRSRHRGAAAPRRRRPGSSRARRRRPRASPARSHGRRGRRRRPRSPARARVGARWRRCRRRRRRRADPARRRRAARAAA